MAKLRVLSGREVCRILSKHGFVEVRRRGSHVVMQRRAESGSTTIQALVEIGLIEKTGRRIRVPFDEIRTEFVVRTAA